MSMLCYAILPYAVPCHKEMFHPSPPARPLGSRKGLLLLPLGPELVFQGGPGDLVGARELELKRC